VVLDPADAAAVGDADDHRQPHGPLRAVAHLGDVADHLLEGGVGKRVELHLDHRPHAVHRHADGGADDAGLGERGVEAAGFTEPCGESIGDAEHPAQRPDVFAEDENALVGRHRVGESAVERRRHRERLGVGGRRRCGLEHGHSDASLASSAESDVHCSRSWGVRVA
jgi:hypothetical protein